MLIGFSAMSMAENLVTVYLKPNSNWPQNSAKIAIYLFNNSTSVTPVWHFMEGPVNGVYSYQFDRDTYSGMIFGRMNSNIVQESDCNFKEEVCWNKSEDIDAPNVNTLYTQDADSWSSGTYTSTTETTFTVTFVNGKKWNDVYAYVWNGTGNDAQELEGGWPGKVISATGNTVTYNGEALDIYSYTYKGFSAPENIIFNNGKAADDADKDQTGDLTFTDGTQYTDAVVFVPVYVVVGSKSNNDTDQAFFPAKWTEASTSTNVMTYDATSSKWVQNILGQELTAQSYKFKVARRPYLESTEVTLYPTGSDIIIDITEANTYDIIITFDDTNNNVDKTVKAKYETFTVTSAGWATAKTNNIVDFSGISGLEAYTATVSGSFVTLKKEGAVRAETALVLKGTYGSEVTKQVPIVAYADAVTNSLKWYNDYYVNPYDNHAIYGLTASNGEAEFTRVIEGQTVYNKAILVLDKPAGGGARELKVVFADEANGIDAVTADQSAEGIFNLNGQRVVAPAKGLYIVNGKKVILK